MYPEKGSIASLNQARKASKKRKKTRKKRTLKSTYARTDRQKIKEGTPLLRTRKNPAYLLVLIRWMRQKVLRARKQKSGGEQRSDVGPEVLTGRRGRRRMFITIDCPIGLRGKNPFYPEGTDEAKDSMGGEKRGDAVISH